MQYFFAKKMDVLFFTAIFFAKNPLGLDIVSAFFLTTEIYFLFFIFSYSELSTKEIPKHRLMGIIACDNCTQSEEKRWKRQVHSAVNTWNSAMLLCAVTEVYRRQRKTVLQNL